MDYDGGMWIKGLFFIICLGSWAQAEQDDASKALDQALANDLGPVCVLGGKSYALGADEEAKCRDRGGTVQIGPRKNLPLTLDPDDPRGKPYFKDREQKYFGPTLQPSPYNHPDPLGSPSGN